MKEKIFKICESVIIAILALAFIVMTIDCLSSFRIAIDEILLEVYKGQAPLVLGTSIGNLFYIIGCSVTLAAIFGYIITLPSQTENNKKD